MTWLDFFFGLVSRMVLMPLATTCQPVREAEFCVFSRVVFEVIIASAFAFLVGYNHYTRRWYRSIIDGRNWTSMTNEMMEYNESCLVSPEHCIVTVMMMT